MHCRVSTSFPIEQKEQIFQMIKALNHTGFVVSDRDAAVAFYRDIVGLRVISEYERQGPGVDQVVGYDGTELKSAVLDIGNGHILELIQYIKPEPHPRPSSERNVMGAAHLALEVDDIHETFDQLVNGGAQALNPPAELAPGRIGCYLQDPDGNWLELLQLD